MFEASDDDLTRLSRSERVPLGEFFVWTLRAQLVDANMFDRVLHDISENRLWELPLNTEGRMNWCALLTWYAMESKEMWTKFLRTVPQHAFHPIYTLKCATTVSRSKIREMVQVFAEETKIWDHKKVEETTGIMCNPPEVEFDICSNICGIVNSCAWIIGIVLLVLVVSTLVIGLICYSGMFAIKTLKSAVQRL